MPQFSPQFVTCAIADAMLAGPPEAAAMVERMTLVLGERADWMNGFLLTMRCMVFDVGGIR